MPEYDLDREWLENAEDEIKRGPFEAIVARKSPRGHRAVILAGTIMVGG